MRATDKDWTAQPPLDQFDMVMDTTVFQIPEGPMEDAALYRSDARWEAFKASIQ
ncbi:hypothetical protein [Sphingobium sp.]|uniref:hypothetical protein n=1 Tax=Sphingobium sp. TaxID=1912891 RepID=UPI002BA17924|nr:hypothetical protein [Sphingobium sp.]HUD90356.1 hypothetical protein [Sphingobium sp.]